jgi:ABC-2 type transport system ATP-binding protein
VAAGEIFGLLGHNGAGKTTLVNQIVGLLRPSGGTIAIAGRDAVADPAFARAQCALMPQATMTMAGMTPRGAIETIARIRGADRRRARHVTVEAAEALDIGAWLDTPGERLSGGVRRLAAFCMATACPPGLVILDEPTNDVDPVRRRLLWAHVRRLAQDGSAVMVVTHNVHEAEDVVTSVVVLNTGRVVAAGSPAHLRAHLRQPSLEHAYITLTDAQNGIPECLA